MRREEVASARARVLSVSLFASGDFYPEKFRVFEKRASEFWRQRSTTRNPSPVRKRARASRERDKERGSDHLLERISSSF